MRETGIEPALTSGTPSNRKKAYASVVRRGAVTVVRVVAVILRLVHEDNLVEIGAVTLFEERSLASPFILSEPKRDPGWTRIAVIGAQKSISFNRKRISTPRRAIVTRIIL